jgi:hypothetical protein
MPTVWHAEEQLYEKSSDKMILMRVILLHNSNINLLKTKSKSVNDDFIGCCLLNMPNAAIKKID